MRALHKIPLLLSLSMLFLRCRTDFLYLRDCFSLQWQFYENAPISTKSTHQGRCDIKCQRNSFCPPSHASITIVSLSEKRLYADIAKSIEHASFLFALVNDGKPVFIFLIFFLTSLFRCYFVSHVLMCGYYIVFMDL